jgi:hypothetical protein
VMERTGPRPEVERFYPQANETYKALYPH